MSKHDSKLRRFWRKLGPGLITGASDGIGEVAARELAGADTDLIVVGRSAAKLAAVTKATIDSPRGKFTMSKAHNPVQDMYLRKVVGNENVYQSVAVKALADPATGCRM